MLTQWTDRQHQKQPDASLTSLNLGESAGKKTEFEGDGIRFKQRFQYQQAVRLASDPPL